MVLSAFDKIILVSKINILIFKKFNLNLHKIDFHKLVSFLQELFKIGESMNVEPCDVQWLFSLPKIFISATHIHRYIQFEVNESRCIWYGPINNNPKNIIIYFHGGGYCTCSPEAYFDFINRIQKTIDSKETNYLLMDYPKAPEFKYPLAINLCYQKYYYLLNLFPNANFIFMGDSSGANLLLQITEIIIKKGIKVPSNLICLSPWVITNIRNKYWKKNLNKDILTQFAVDLAIKSYLGNINSQRWDLNILDLTYHKFPQIYLRAGKNELILDEILELILNIKKKEGKIKYKIIENMPHAFDIFHGFNNDFDLDYMGLIDIIRTTLKK